MPFESMSEEYARQIATWQYGGEYAIYSFTGDVAAVAELCGGGYFAWLQSGNGPAGYVCAGAPAQIPLEAGSNVYGAAALDVGIGLRPDLCGKGGGRAFFTEAVQFVQKQYGASALRLTVAAFNKRALRVYQKAGFGQRCTVRHARTQQEFIVMLLSSEGAMGHRGTEK